MKRSPIKRVAGLKAAAPMRAKAKARKPATGKRRPDEPASATRTLVMERAGRRCERCGRTIVGEFSIHHRQPRGMGGSRAADKNQPQNLLLLCGSGTTGCHGWIESHRAKAISDGFIVPSWADPAAVSVFIGQRWARFLTPEGTYAEDLT